MAPLLTIPKVLATLEYCMGEWTECVQKQESNGSLNVCHTMITLMKTKHRQWQKFDCSSKQFNW